MLHKHSNQELTHSVAETRYRNLYSASSLFNIYVINQLILSTILFVFIPKVLSPAAADLHFLIWTGPSRFESPEPIYSFVGDWSQNSAGNEYIAVVNRLRVRKETKLETGVCTLGLYRKIDKIALGPHTSCTVHV